MIIAKGEDRVAFVGETHTVKLAKSHPGRFLKDVKSLMKRHGVEGVMYHWSLCNTDDHHSLKGRLFHGLAANRREGRLSREFGGVVVPARSLLGGIVNLQRTASIPELTHGEIHKSFAEHLGSSVVRLPHMLEKPNNLGVLDGQVRFVDGGSAGLEELLHSRRTDIEASLGSVAAKLALSSE